MGADIKMDAVGKAVIPINCHDMYEVKTTTYV